MHKTTSEHTVRSSVRKVTDAKVPVLVLGTGITSLGVVRAFGRAGVPVYPVSEHLGFTASSRWARKPKGPYRPLPDWEDLVAYIRRLPFDSAVIIPCSDYWTQELSRTVPMLPDGFCTCLAPNETLELFLDKSRFREFLMREHIPHPRTVVLDSDNDLESLDDKYFDGAFLKPTNSQSFFWLYEVKAFRVSSKSDALQRYRDIRHNGLSVVLQEYIPGPPTNHYFVDGFVDRHGSTCVHFARQRLRMFPSDFGNSTYMVSVKPQRLATAIADLDRVLARTNYRGIFSAEFKLDPRDDQFKLLEINTRPWWYVDFAVTSGADVCLMAYRDALGEEVASVTSYRSGRTCVYPYWDFNACRELHRTGQLSLASWAWSWLTARQPIWAWDDPMPYANWLFGKLRSKIKRIVAGFRRS